MRKKHLINQTCSISSDGLTILSIVCPYCTYVFMMGIYGDIHVCTIFIYGKQFVAGKPHPLKDGWEAICGWEANPGWEAKRWLGNHPWVAGKPPLSYGSGFFQPRCLLFSPGHSDSSVGLGLQGPKFSWVLKVVVVGFLGPSVEFGAASNG